MNEFSASDGDIFPYRFKKYGLGKVIGKRTWGGVVGIRGSAAARSTAGQLMKPEFAPYAPDGKTWIMEGVGVEPDIYVDNDPAQEYAGIDEQLNKAIEVILEELKTGEVQTAHRSRPFPIKVKRRRNMADTVKVSCHNCGATNNYPRSAAGKKPSSAADATTPSRCRGRSRDPAGQGRDSLSPGGPARPGGFLLADLRALPHHASGRRAAGHAQGGRAHGGQGESRSQPEAAAGLGIHGVPTFIIFSRGTERGRMSGAMPETDLSLWVASRI